MSGYRLPSILDEAKSVVEGDRAQEYGDMSESFQRIAGLWSAYLNVPINKFDVAKMMILLKVSRAKESNHRDSYVDIAGYVACVDKLLVDPKPFDNSTKEFTGPLNFCKICEKQLLPYQPPYCNDCSVDKMLPDANEANEINRVKDIENMLSNASKGYGQVMGSMLQCGVSINGVCLMPNCTSPECQHE